MQPHERRRSVESNRFCVFSIFGRESPTTRKRKKKPSKRFCDKFGHTPLSIEEEVPWKCRQLVIGTGAGALPVMEEVKREAHRRKIRLAILPTTEAIQALQENPEKTNAILHGYMLKVESGPDLEKALDRYACRLHPRWLHDAAGYSSRRDGSRNPGRDDGRYPVGQKLSGNVFRQGAKAQPDQSCESTMRQIRSEDDVLGPSS
jgi:hypothetical protein